ncbi:pectinesterase 3-like [Aristolochia californica]|uniref:pectinesterase 3-like n=1 Tax=Aristolochia californica TaxID=171875 RepID=UPI0035DD3AC6
MKVAVGEGLIAQDLQIQNTAGPEKGQAVALRVGAEKSVINRCKLIAYQDTLYPHSLRQFFRDCFVTGTVDFIFGNSAVVFQNCKIIARKPGKGQGNMVTAQGRNDPNQNTGTSIQNCDVIPSADLIQANFFVKSYLGRPWKQYSRTVYMQSFIDNHIDPSGWLPWSVNLIPKIVFIIITL